MMRVNVQVDPDNADANSSRNLYGTIVNIIYVETVLVVVKSHQVNGDLSCILQNQAFECFSDTVGIQKKTTMMQLKDWRNKMIFNKPKLPQGGANDAFNSPMQKKSRLLFNLWCTVIGVLSETQLENILLRLEDAIDDLETNLCKARLLRGIRATKLNLDSTQNVTKSCRLISFLLKIFRTTHQECKRSCAETITLILYPLADATQSGISTKGSNENNMQYHNAIGEWWKIVYEVYVAAKSWSHKKKHHRLSLPMMMSALCVMEKESFLSHRLMCCETLFKYARQHDPKHRTIGLACLVRILETYLKHFADGQAGTNTHLKNLNNQILVDLKWQFTGDHQDGIVSYILTIAEKKPIFAITEIVKPCLEEGIESKHALAGLRALNAIMYGAESDILHDENDDQISKSSRFVSMNVVEKTHRINSTANHDDILETSHGPSTKTVLKKIVLRMRPISDS